MTEEIRFLDNSPSAESSNLFSQDDWWNKSIRFCKNHGISVVLGSLLFFSLFVFIITPSADRSSSTIITHIICVGDSITWGAWDKKTTYPYFLEQELIKAKGKHFKVVNYGNSSRTAMKSADMPYWDTTTYANVLKSKPDIVILQLGTNDAKHHNWDDSGDDFKNDYKEMIQILTHLSSKPKVYVNIPPPVNKDGVYDISLHVVNEIFPILIPQIVEESGLDPVLNSFDVFNAMGGVNMTHKDWFRDNVHPSTKGYEMMGKFIASQLIERLYH